MTAVATAAAALPPPPPGTALAPEDVDGDALAPVPEAQQLATLDDGSCLVDAGLLRRRRRALLEKGRSRSAPPCVQ